MHAEMADVARRLLADLLVFEDFGVFALARGGGVSCHSCPGLGCRGCGATNPGAEALAELPQPQQLQLFPEALKNAQGKVAVITGATAGVGLEAARILAGAGCDVYLTGRTLAKAEAAAAEIRVGKVVPMELNVASLDSVRRFVSTWKSNARRPVDILACNAGLALGQSLKEPEFTEDGFELTLATNHLGHFLLVNEMLQQLSPSARIVVTASSVHNPATGDPGAQATLGDLSGLQRGGAMADGGTFDAAKAYKDSKLCNVLFTLELARRLKSTGITANCFSPGLIPSPTFFRYQSQGFSSVFAFAAQNILKIAETPEFGGMALALMALDPSLDQRSGCFYSAIPPGKHLFVEDQPSPEAQNQREAAELWQRSAAMVGL
ncbi:unnamed protein product [Effrenium voratum]|uniref:Protochlorophyllide reductase n=1 Tax=Effrenium voratum TaxID=2562239 RepID=A0AA36HQ90_9DINO|nr:unnamed protein product [Effrenium voratum]